MVRLADFLVALVWPQVPRNLKMCLGSVGSSGKAAAKRFKMLCLTVMVPAVSPCSRQWLM